MIKVGHRFLGVVVTAALLVASLGVSTSASAIVSGGIGGRPANPDPNNPRTQSIFVYNLNGGATKQDQLLVVNASSQAADIELYPVDATLTQTGDITCKQAVEPRNGVGSWIKLDKSEVNLAAGTNETVGFTLSVPERADVGEQDGCLIIQRKSAAKTSTRGGIQLETRQAIRVAVIVPGEINRNVTIKQFAVTPESDHQNIAIAVQNKGNVSADVSVKLRIKDMFGHVVYQNGGGYAVLRDSTRSFNYESSINNWYGGFYKAELSIQYNKRAGTFGTAEPSQLITKTTQPIEFFLWPAIWVIVLVAIVVAVLIFLVIKLVIRHHRRSNGLSIK
ncbi:MAG: hypothetical protein WAW91_01765 [Candidatus Nanoperiomorbaceae bacterium]